MNRLLVLPSVSMLLVALDLGFRHIGKRELFRRQERRVFYVGMVVCALVLYAASLDYLPNVYRLGFLPIPVALTALAGIVIAEWSVPLALWIAAGFIACDLRLLPSANLIDYFIDPVTAFVAGLWCVVHLLRRRRGAQL
jgi:hypothetical protein